MSDNKNSTGLIHCDMEGVKIQGTAPEIISLVIKILANTQKVFPDNCREPFRNFIKKFTACGFDFNLLKKEKELEDLIAILKNTSTYEDDGKNKTDIPFNS